MEIESEDWGHDVGTFFLDEGGSNEWVLYSFHDYRCEAIPGIGGTEEG